MSNTDETSKILVERGKGYGPYKDVARTAQQLKAVFHRKDDWQYLLPRERESVDLICTKLSRLLHGNGDKKDTLNDISGYALLAREDGEIFEAAPDPVIDLVTPFIPDNESLIALMDATKQVLICVNSGIKYDEGVWKTLEHAMEGIKRHER